MSGMRIIFPNRRRLVFLTALIGPLILWIVITVLTIQFQTSQGIPGEIPVDNAAVRKGGIPVITGRIVNNRSPDAGYAREILDRNEYKPISGLGEAGQAVSLPKPLIAKAAELYKINQFNLVVSDRISVNRTLPDVRKAGCKDFQYVQASEIDASIIIVFHNEAWSTLIRTVHSVINRSPRAALREIILVDDNSNREFLRQELDDYVAQLPVPTFVLRMENRSGLIRSRLRGAQVAKGKVLTFLDAHCECTTGWLEPLLQRIAEDRKNVVCPIIDVIKEDTFQYVQGIPLNWGSFTWRLQFRWTAMSDREMERRKSQPLAPIKSPVMAGGLFAIDKSYFEEIGAYDQQMSIWGGENIEMSFRIWQCGGNLEIIPCSHVGHVFRKSTPHDFPGGVQKVLGQNLVRVAEVWMDEFKEFFYKVASDARQYREGIDVSDRKQLRERLKCHNFRWYLENIFPENSYPLDAYTVGQIKNHELGTCLEGNYGVHGVHAKIYLRRCAIGDLNNQLFIYTRKNELKTDESLCLDATHSGDIPDVVLRQCHHVGATQEWKYDARKKSFVHKDSGLCLDRPVNSKSPSLLPCNGASSQQWILSNVDWKNPALSNLQL